MAQATSTLVSSSLETTRTIDFHLGLLSPLHSRILGQKNLNFFVTASCPPASHFWCSLDLLSVLQVLYSLRILLYPPVIHTWVPSFSSLSTQFGGQLGAFSLTSPAFLLCPGGPLRPLIGEMETFWCELCLVSPLPLLGHENHPCSHLVYLFPTLDQALSCIHGLVHFCFF